MSTQKNLQDLEDAWAALANGEMDRLASFYAEEMIFVLPGQNNIIRGRNATSEKFNSLLAQSIFELRVPSQFRNNAVD